MPEKKWDLILILGNARPVMHWSNLYQTLEDYLCRGNDDEIFIFCPFINTNLLLSLVDKKSKLTVVTSWRKDHIAYGSSSLNLYEHFEENEKWNLYVNNKIHAKVYSRNLETMLTGSANLTKSALFDHNSSNYENLELVECSQNDKNTLIEIIRTSKFVDKSYFDEMKSWFDENHEQFEKTKLSADDVLWQTSGFDMTSGLIPLEFDKFQILVDGLFRREKVSFTFREYNKVNMLLDAISIGENFLTSEGIFLEVFRSRFRQLPYISDFITLLNDEDFRFGSVEAWFKHNCEEFYDMSYDDRKEYIRRIMSWLCEIYPDEFEIIQPNHTHVIRRKLGLMHQKLCEYTGLRLDRSWYYSEDGYPVTGLQYKSCPWCSQLDGTQLIFRVARRGSMARSKVNSGFGFTPQRVSGNNPDGIQTWCVKCRAEPKPSSLPQGGLGSSELIQKHGKILNISSRYR